jgi:hypothetical protein
MGPGRLLVAVAAARHDLYDAFIKHERGSSPFESGAPFVQRTAPFLRITCEFR